MALEFLIAFFLVGIPLAFSIVFGIWVMKRPLISQRGKVFRFSVCALVFVSGCAAMSLGIWLTTLQFGRLIRWSFDGGNPLLNSIFQAFGISYAVHLFFLPLDALAWFCAPYRRAVLLLDDDPLTDRQIAEPALALKFCLGNFLVGLITYAYLYNPTGTAKPSWTEWLG
jgi:hypothetical protein